jgi:NTP pyrophosphatase (non-canonical NTP hydrolase)
MNTEKEVAAVLGPLVQKAHLTAKGKGFWTPKPSERKMLVLMITEVAEIVEVDRQENPKPNALPEGWREVGNTIEYVEFYRNHVKGTMGEEIADVCIRLFDYIGGYHKSKMELVWKAMYMELNSWRGVEIKDIADMCFTIVQRLCSISSEHFKQSYIGEILAMCFAMAEQHGIDLLGHIDAKMMFNELREHKHGKQY